MGVSIRILRPCLFIFAAAPVQFAISMCETVRNARETERIMSLNLAHAVE